MVKAGIRQAGARAGVWAWAGAGTRAKVEREERVLTGIVKRKVTQTQPKVVDFLD